MWDNEKLKDFRIEIVLLNAQVIICILFIVLHSFT